MTDLNESFERAKQLENGWVSEMVNVISLKPRLEAMSNQQIVIHDGRLVFEMSNEARAVYEKQERNEEL